MAMRATFSNVETSPSMVALEAARREFSGTAMRVDEGATVRLR
jgi:hypothetical protein